MPRWPCSGNRHNMPMILQLGPPHLTPNSPSNGLRMPASHHSSLHHMRSLCASVSVPGIFCHCSPHLHLPCPAVMSDIAEFMLNTPWGSDYGPRTEPHLMPCMRPVLSETGWPRMRAPSVPSVPTSATAGLDKGQLRSLQHLSLNATLIPSRLSRCSK